MRKHRGILHFQTPQDRLLHAGGLKENEKRWTLAGLLSVSFSCCETKSKLCLPPIECDLASKTPRRISHRTLPGDAQIRGKVITMLTAPTTFPDREDARRSRH